MQESLLGHKAQDAGSPRPPGQGGSLRGEGVDRAIKKRKFTPARIAMAVGAVVFVALIVFLVSSMADGSRLNVERSRLTISPVTRAAFQEFISVTGNVMPRTTVYLDAIEGGRVEEVYVREGEMVEEGQRILLLSNNDLQLRLMSNEAGLAEQVSNLENMRFQVEQSRLNLRQQLVEMDYQIRRLQSLHRRNEQLFEKKLISQQEYEAVRDEYEYYLRRRELTVQSHRQDSLAQELRIAQMEEAVNRMRKNFAVLQESLENLLVRAPVSGHLTMLDAEIGELRGPGSRFGQIDVLDGGYKVRSGIDEFYISRVRRDQTGRTQSIDGKVYLLVVTRVYPEVRDGRFEVDLDFVDEQPENMRRGQTIRFDLELGDPVEATLIPRGSFYQTTGGNWIYVVDPSGEFAVRRSIRIGRQNPMHYEVLEGLEPGEQVVTSSYETFGDADRLVFK